MLDLEKVGAGFEQRNRKGTLIVSGSSSLHACRYFGHCNVCCGNDSAIRVENGSAESRGCGLRGSHSKQQTTKNEEHQTANAD